MISLQLELSDSYCTLQDLQNKVLHDPIGKIRYVFFFFLFGFLFFGYHKPLKWPIWFWNLRCITILFICYVDTSVSRYYGFLYENLSKFKVASVKGSGWEGVFEPFLRNYDWFLSIYIHWFELPWSRRKKWCTTRLIRPKLTYSIYLPPSLFRVATKHP